MSKSFLPYVLFFLLPFYALAQQEKEIKIIGRIVDEDNNPIEQAQIANQTAFNDYFTDFKGYFSATIEKGDTLVISSLGHKPFRLIIPDDLDQKELELEVQLPSQYILLDEVTTLGSKVELDLSYHKVGMDRDEISQEFINQQISKGSGQMETVGVNFVAFFPWLFKKLRGE